MEIIGYIGLVELEGPISVIGNRLLVKSTIKDLVDFIGMTPISEVVIFNYPPSSIACDTFTAAVALGYEEEEFTPFVLIQPLHESFVVYDNWDRKMIGDTITGYAHVIVDSCKPFDLSSVEAFLGSRLYNTKTFSKFLTTYYPMRPLGEANANSYQT